jgi:hypothetical protein
MTRAALSTKELFHEVLIKPALEGATELHVVSGYASPTMVTRHINELHSATDRRVELDLLVGMTGMEGLPQHSLSGFRSIPRQAAGARFSCAFTLPGKSIHSKVYVWSNEAGPYRAWTGSANYTQMGFGISRGSGSHHEAMVEIDPAGALDYVLDSASNSISYLNPDLADYLAITADVPFGEAKQGLVLQDEGSVEAVVLPLVQLTRNVGQVHEKSGLNWGQREGRNPDQAYIPIPSAIANKEFFPPRGEHFQLITEDGESFIATVAQDGNKALETPHDNSLLGKYFRKRLGLTSGVFVDTEDLTRFGSTGVIVEYVGDDLYRLVFKPGIEVRTGR